MKKLIFTMLIALFSILSFNEAKAQDCPVGYQEKPYSIIIGGCTYNVLVCVDCNIAYPSDVILKKYSKADTNCNQLP